MAIDVKVFGPPAEPHDGGEAVEDVSSLPREPLMRLRVPMGDGSTVKQLREELLSRVRGYDESVVSQDLDLSATLRVMSFGSLFDLSPNDAVNDVIQPGETVHAFMVRRGADSGGDTPEAMAEAVAETTLTESVIQASGPGSPSSGEAPSAEAGEAGTAADSVRPSNAAYAEDFGELPPSITLKYSFWRPPTDDNNDASGDGVPAKDSIEMSGNSTLMDVIGKLRIKHSIPKHIALDLFTPHVSLRVNRNTPDVAVFYVLGGVPENHPLTILERVAGLGNDMDAAEHPVLADASQSGLQEFQVCPEWFPVAAPRMNVTDLSWFLCCAMVAVRRNETEAEMQRRMLAVLFQYSDSAPACVALQFMFERRKLTPALKSAFANACFAFFKGLLANLDLFAGDDTVFKKSPACFEEWSRLASELPENFESALTIEVVPTDCAASLGNGLLDTALKRPVRIRTADGGLSKDRYSRSIIEPALTGTVPADTIFRHQQDLIDSISAALDAGAPLELVDDDQVALALRLLPESSEGVDAVAIFQAKAHGDRAWPALPTTTAVDFESRPKRGRSLFRTVAMYDLRSAGQFVIAIRHSPSDGSRPTVFDEYGPSSADPQLFDPVTGESHKESVESSWDSLADEDLSTTTEAVFVLLDCSGSMDGMAGFEGDEALVREYRRKMKQEYMERFEAPPLPPGPLSAGSKQVLKNSACLGRIRYMILKFPKEWDLIKKTLRNHGTDLLRSVSEHASGELERLIIGDVDESVSSAAIDEDAISVSVEFPIISALSPEVRVGKRQTTLLVARDATVRNVIESLTDKFDCLPEFLADACEVRRDGGDVLELDNQLLLPDAGSPPELLRVQLADEVDYNRYVKVEIEGDSWSYDDLTTEVDVPGGTCDCVSFRLIILDGVLKLGASGSMRHVARARCATVAGKTFMWQNLQASGDGGSSGHLVEQGVDWNLNQARNVEFDSRAPSWGLPDTVMSRMVTTQQLILALANRSLGYDLPTALGLVTFSDQVDEACPLTRMVGLWRAKVQKSRPHGDTHLFDALNFARGKLMKFSEKHPSVLRRRIIVFSDGVDEGSALSSLDVAASLHADQIVVDSILVSPDQANVDLHAIAKATGGLSFHPSTIAEAIRVVEQESMVSSENRVLSRHRVPAGSRMTNVLLRAKSDVPIDSCDFASLSRHIRVPLALRNEHEGRVLSLAHSLESGATNQGLSSSQVSSEQLQRLLAEMAELHRNPHPKADVYACESDLRYWKVVMDGGGLYVGGVVEFYMAFTDKYPLRAPIVRFITNIRHANVSPQGRVCHAILAQDWMSTTTVRELVDAIYGLLLNPSFDTVLDTELGEAFAHADGSYEAIVLQAVEEHAQSTTRDEIRAKIAAMADILAKGTRVRLVNLATGELNGCLGTVENFDLNRNGRYGIHLDEKDVVVAIRPSNVESLDAPVIGGTDLPESLVCPITKQLFDDPVVTPRGLTYSRAALQGVLVEHGCDPADLEKSEDDRQPLRMEDCEPNDGTAALVAQYRRDQQLRAAQLVSEAGLKIPAEFICPISERLMHDPMQTPKGRTYARDALEQHIDSHNCDPEDMSLPATSRPPLEMDECVPDVALAQDLANFKRETLEGPVFRGLSAVAQEAFRELFSSVLAVPRSVVAGPPPQHPCGQCGRSDVKTKLCGGCKHVRYCSAECQRRAWNDHQHFCGNS